MTLSLNVTLKVTRVASDVPYWHQVWFQQGTLKVAHLGSPSLPYYCQELFFGNLSLSGFVVLSSITPNFLDLFTLLFLLIFGT